MQTPLDKNLIENGFFEPRLREADLLRTVRETVEIMQSQANLSKSKLLLVCQTKEKSLIFDDVRVQQILIQLLSNLVERLKPRSEIQILVSTNIIPRKSSTKVAVTISHKQSETSSVFFNPTYEEHL